VLGWYDVIVAGVTEITATGRVPDSARAAYAALAAQLQRVIDGADRGSLLAAAADGGTLTHGQLASNAAVLLFGGIETTEGMIATLMLDLLRHPEQLELARSDGDLRANAIEESLRREPAAASVDRYATRDVTLGGASIRRGDLITVSLTGANRDPETFPDPDRFDVRRANARLHLAFAQGPHVCLGMHLARLEARAAVDAVLERLPGVRLEPGRSAMVRGLVFRKPDAVPVLA
jgi:cytochrome P450